MIMLNLDGKEISDKCVPFIAAALRENKVK
jgi:hypothetical protein